MNIIFGKYAFQLQRESNIQRIFDIVRKKWIILTAEEQVRQMWLHYLIYDKGVAISLIAVEKTLYFNQKKKRFDICVFDNNASPEVLIECKSPKIELNNTVMEQLSTYNSLLKTKKFILTNGLQHVGYCIENEKIIPLENY